MSDLVPPPPPDKPVGECCIEELIICIAERCNAFVWAGCVPTKNGNDSETNHYQGGNRATCVGLASLSKFVTMRKLASE